MSKLAKTYEEADTDKLLELEFQIVERTLASERLTAKPSDCARNGDVFVPNKGEWEKVHDLISNVKANSSASFRSKHKEMLENIESLRMSLADSLTQATATVFFTSFEPACVMILNQISDQHHKEDDEAEESRVELFDCVSVVDMSMLNLGSVLEVQMMADLKECINTLVELLDSLRAACGWFPGS